MTEQQLLHSGVARIRPAGGIQNRSGVEGFSVLPLSFHDTCEFWAGGQPGLAVISAQLLKRPFVLPRGFTWAVSFARTIQWQVDTYRYGTDLLSHSITTELRFRPRKVLLFESWVLSLLTIRKTHFNTHLQWRHVFNWVLLLFLLLLFVCVCERVGLYAFGQYTATAIYTAFSLCVSSKILNIF